ncbi:hypothetical protein PANT_7c00321 [Moesziomyces antarcticus T-34]|uniref:Uncharacterized protein n=1 Tax=Pseudozyma antarctica (strain T-34) TaxID=1151754 RepID=M9MBR8_PSEA3|nr:hypothetical protein PANT_7c00321 [Moesziomyces antarcticus T-34]
MLDPSVFCSLAEPRLFSTVSPRVPLCCAIFFTGPMGARTDPSAHMASARQPLCSSLASQIWQRAAAFFSGSSVAIFPNTFFFVAWVRTKLDSRDHSFYLMRQAHVARPANPLSVDPSPDLYPTSPELASASVNGWSGSKLSRTGPRSKTGAACRPSI